MSIIVSRFPQNENCYSSLLNHVSFPELLFHLATLVHTNTLTIAHIPWSDRVAQEGGKNARN